VNFKVFNTFIDNVLILDPENSIKISQKKDENGPMVLIHIYNMVLILNTEIEANMSFIKANPKVKVTLQKINLGVAIRYKIDEAALGVTAKVAAMTLTIGKIDINVQDSWVSLAVQGYIDSHKQKILAQINKKIREAIEEKLSSMQKTVGLASIIAKLA